MSQTTAIQQPRADAASRVELACALRWAARLNLHEATANHFSAAISEDGHEFLINPAGHHFSEIRARDLVHVDGRSATQPDNVDPTAWAIHGALHRNNPAIRCALHTHAPYATALSCLQDPSLPPIDQNTMRFYQRVAVDTGFSGMGLDDEAERLSRIADAGKPILLLCQHGVVALGETIADAFDSLYYFERASQTWLNVLATGRAYRLAEPEVAERTARQWEQYPGFARQHFDALLRLLDRDEPDFRH
jgi:ribulose-5-phosphate 4-epimerase/fuculose-1-phosphate aldolase